MTILFEDYNLYHKDITENETDEKIFYIHGV